jgi:hypothetical protein
VRGKNAVCGGGGDGGQEQDHALSDLPVWQGCSFSDHPESEEFGKWKNDSG